MINKHIIQIVFWTLLSTQLYSQSSSLDKQVNGENFNHQLFLKTLSSQIDNERKRCGIGKLLKDSTLQKASDNQALFMAENNELILTQSGKKKSTEQRIAFYGGQAFGKEIISRYKIQKGEKAESYQTCVTKIVEKWLKNKSNARTIRSPRFLFMGLSVKLNSKKTHLYISCVLGNYQSLKGIINSSEKLKYPLSKKGFGLKPYNTKICRKIDANEHLSLLHKGLIKEGQIIYYQTDDYKSFKKLFRKEHSGIALDVIQAEQYLTSGKNIIHSETSWKGIVHHPIYSDEFDKENLYEGKEARQHLKIPLAKLENEYNENTEYNLLIIQDKHVCANISPSYTENMNLSLEHKVDFLADTIILNANYDYTPTNEQNELVFKVPFKKNKFDYQQADIKPIIQSLDEPNFLINKIEIEAFSSIEGGKEDNLQLQTQRAQSIEQALKTFIATNPNIDKASVTTDENWADFCQDVKGTKFEYLSGKTLEEAQNIIRQKKLENELETILSKHRYAKVKLHVTYQFTPSKEEEYVLKRLNKCIQNNNRIKALAIQKYIFKQIVKGRYSKEAVTGQTIPQTPDFAGLKMNQYWLLRYTNNLKSDICKDIENLHQLQADNMYITFNHIFCQVNNNKLSDANTVEDLQLQLENLYTTRLPEATIDALYLDFLFKVIKGLKGSPNEKSIPAYLKKIKELADVQDMNPKNASKLAQLFIANQDYLFSIQVLEPFIDIENPQEDMIFTYISLCTHYPTKIKSHQFYRAVKIASEMNYQRLRELFREGKISFQIFDNMRVKKIIEQIVNRS